MDEILNPIREQNLVQKLDEKYLPPDSLVENDPKKTKGSNQFHKFGLKKYKIMTRVTQQKPKVIEVDDFGEIALKKKPQSVPLIT